MELAAKWLPVARLSEEEEFGEKQNRNYNSIDGDNNMIVDVLFVSPVDANNSDLCSRLAIKVIVFPQAFGLGAQLA